MTSQSTALPWQYPHYTEIQGVSKILFPGKSVKEPAKAPSGRTFLATDQILVRAATGTPGRQHKSQAGRPKRICSGFPVWVGFPALHSTRSSNMSASRRLHKCLMSSLFMQSLSHLDRNSRTYRRLPLYISMSTSPCHSLAAPELAVLLLLQPCYSPDLGSLWN